MATQIPPQITAIIIGIVAIVIGFGLINISESFPQAWAISVAGVVAIIGGIVIIAITIKNSI